MGNACSSLNQKLPVEPIGARQQPEHQHQQTSAELSQAQSDHSYQPEDIQLSPLPAPAYPSGTQAPPLTQQTVISQPVSQQPAGYQQQSPAETPDGVPGVPAQKPDAAVAASHQRIAEPEPAASSAEQPATGSYGQQPASAEQAHLEPLAHQGGKSMEAAAKENVPPAAVPPLEHETSLSSPPPNYRARRRASVSAEVASLAASVQVQATKPRKSSETEQVLVRAMKHSFLFSDLEEEQKIDCISSMFKKDVNANEVVIRQGEEGDNFYVIAEGVFTARIAQADGCERVVFTYDGKGAFGELALMYNCPRAATVKAETPGLLWGMDRLTFRRIILASRIAQRERFEEVLRHMSVFSSLSPGQKASIADCLVLEVFEEGTHILKEGEELTPESKFYVVQSGTVACFRMFEGETTLVKEIGNGGFFGEVALITKSATRAADCVALTRCKLLAMGRDAFERLMGPAEEILKKEVDEYARLNSDLARQAGSASSADANTVSEQSKQGKSAGRGAGKAAKKASLAKPPSKKAGPDGPRYSLV